MPNGANAQRRAALISGLTSLALHAGVLGLALDDPRAVWDRNAPHSMVWIEAPPEPPSEPPPSPPPPITESAVAPSHDAPSRTPRPKRVTPPRPAPSQDGATSDVPPGATDPDALAEEPSAIADSGGTAPPEQPSEAQGGADKRDVRTAGPPQFSLWVRAPQLERTGLIRAAITLLMAVPGLRDTFRGSGLQPANDLSVLRVFLPGLRAERLMLAGKHLEGEQPLREAAARIAAMRAAELDWRGDSDLRATAWVDGSGVDRGLALHGGAFVIGARKQMASLLGQASWVTRLLELSRMRESVALLAVIERADLYFPRLGVCGLQWLRASVASYGDVHRMSMTADYENRWAAKQASTCLGGLEHDGAVSQLRAWLARATVTPNGQRTVLRTDATKSEIERLVDDLSWALRRARI